MFCHRHEETDSISVSNEETNISRFWFINPNLEIFHVQIQLGTQCCKEIRKNTETARRKTSSQRREGTSSKLKQRYSGIWQLYPQNFISARSSPGILYGQVWKVQFPVQPPRKWWESISPLQQGVLNQTRHIWWECQSLFHQENREFHFSEQSYSSPNRWKPCCSNKL